MKKRIHLSLLVALFGLSLALPLLAEEGSGTKEEGPAWLTDFEKAKTVAAEKKMDLLINFSGSDWCGWCNRLDGEVFSRPAFLSEASKLFVLVNLDFPRRKANPDKEKNEKIRVAYFVTGFPTILLLDADGRLYGRTGYKRGGPENYVAHLKTFQERKKERDTLLEGLESTTGEEQKQAIGTLVKKLREWKILVSYSKEITAAVEKRLQGIEGDEAKAADLEKIFELLQGDSKGHGSVLAPFRALLEKTQALDPEGKLGLKEKYLGEVYQAALADNDAEAGKKYAAMIRELDPKNEQGLLEIVCFEEVNDLFRKQDFAGAAEKAEGFLAKVKPKDRGDILYWAAGVGRLRNKEMEKAKENMKKLVELYPSSQFASRARRFLSQQGG